MNMNAAIRAAVRVAAMFLVVCCATVVGRAQDTCCPAPAQQGSRGRITLSTVMRDTDRVVTAHLLVVDSTGREAPLANATVGVYVQRLFGLMPVGEEHTAVTNEQGDAELIVPPGIPGDPSGQLTIVARVEENEALAGVQGSAVAEFGVPVVPPAEPFPPALWEPRAPFPMILTFSILFGGVWIAYTVVFSQVIGIKNNHRKDPNHEA